MNKIIMKNDFIIFKKRSKALLKNYKMFFILVVAGILFLSPNIYQMYLANLHLVKQVSNIIITFFGFCVALYAMFSKKHFIKFHHADVFYLSPTTLKAKLIKTFLVPQIIINLIVATLICFIINGGVALIDTALLFLIMNAAIFQNIIRYNAKLSNVEKILYLILNLSVIPTCLGNYIKSIVCIAFFVFNILLLIKFSTVRLNREKLLYEATMYDKIQHAARNNNFGEMQVIQIEHSSIKKRTFSYIKALNYKNALIEKIILSMRRTDINLVLCLFVSYLVAFLINILFFKIDIMVMLLLTVALINITEMLNNQMDLLLKKAKMGLFLPYQKKVVVLAYTKANVTLSFILCIVTVIGFKSNILMSFLAFITHGIFIFIRYYFKNADKYKILKIVSSLVALGLSYTLMR